MSASATNERAPCPPAVLKLVERFHEHLDAYKQQAYKETQVRREFIDPFFTALGWDVANKAGHAEAYKDVIHEDAIKVGGSTKAPDYCFRIGGVRKFFVEAKKPVIGVKDEPGPAYQLRRYAWSNKLPLSIVTDFEELAVYDCRIKPKPADRPSTARVMYVTYDQYPDRWGQIAAIFEKESILKGSFDKYAESTRRKRGTAEVDAEFLKEIEEWRELLARNIALRNRGLSVRELNFAVTRTIDRIIFLRMCEDRGVETYEQLRVLPNGPRIYPRLVELFYRADERYNSGLFHFQLEKGRAEEPDELTPDLVIDDRVLKDIIKRLYYPECPYEFSVLPAEILGHVYEQFLGKVIRLTEGHRAVIEEKPEVKKAGGVYYTPSYIVDYIVKHTVSKLLESKIPADVGPMLEQRKGTGARHPTRAQDQSRDRKGTDKTLRILDPACGSGSFLLGAYQYLLDWHLKWYTENDPEKWTRRKNPPIYQVGTSSQYRDSHGAVPQFGDAIDKPLPHGRGSDQRAPHQRGAAWRLTVAERKRILLNNIYGVDIDPQAVEVTKLSLLLKVLEGENQQTLENQLRLFHERALPDLGSNIKCGNSLIGPDFYDNQQLSLLDEEERYRINAFDWHAEFPEVFAPGGSQAPNRARKEAAILPPAPGHQPLPHGRGSDHPGGFDAVIGNPPYGAPFAPIERQYLQARTECFAAYADSYVAFLDVGLGLLRAGGNLGMIIPSAVLGGPAYLRVREYLLTHALWTYIVLLPYDVFPGAYIDTCIVCMQSQGEEDESHEVLTYEYPKRAKVREIAELAYERVRQVAWISDAEIRIILDPSTVRLVSQLQDRAGAVLGDYVEIKRGVLPGHDSLNVERTERYSDQYFEGDVYRYVLKDRRERYIAFDESLRERPRERKWFQGSRILLRRLVSRKFRLMAVLAEDKFITNKNLYSVLAAGTSPVALILGVLNSKLLSYLYVKQVTQAAKDDFSQVTIRDIRGLPFPKAIDKPRRLRMVELVERMLSLHKELDAARTPVDKTAIGRQIEATDRQIDQLVYDLYGLTDDEIRIVEEAASS